jgi:hypothetical protein
MYILAAAVPFLYMASTASLSLAVAASSSFSNDILSKRVAWRNCVDSPLITESENAVANTSIAGYVLSKMPLGAAASLIRSKLLFSTASRSSTLRAHNTDSSVKVSYDQSYQQATIGSIDCNRLTQRSRCQSTMYTITLPVVVKGLAEPRCIPLVRFGK